jgi:copper chaperone CopZ
VLLTSVWAVFGSAAQQREDMMDTGPVEEVQFHSSKISGDRDRTRLEADISALDGVRSVDADPTTHLVTVRFDPTVLDRNAIQTTIENDGYKVDQHADEVRQGAAAALTPFSAEGESG